MNSMTAPVTANVGDQIAHDLMPGFVMTVEETAPCERHTNRYVAHTQFRITDPEGETDWLCSYDCHLAGPAAGLPRRSPLTDPALG